MKPTAAAFYKTAEAADPHADYGAHRQHSTGWADNTFVETVGPVMAGELDLRNGWSEPGGAAKAAHDLRFQTASDMLGDLLRWSVVGHHRTVTSVGRRAILLAFVLRPDLFPDGRRGLRDIAKHFKAGTAQGISKYSREILGLSNGIFAKGNCLSAGQRKAYQFPHGGDVRSRTGARTFQAAAQPTAPSASRRKPWSDPRHKDTRARQHKPRCHCAGAFSVGA